MEPIKASEVEPKGGEREVAAALVMSCLRIMRDDPDIVPEPKLAWRLKDAYKLLTGREQGSDGALDDLGELDTQ